MFEQGIELTAIGVFWGKRAQHKGVENVKKKPHISVWTGDAIHGWKQADYEAINNLLCQGDSLFELFKNVAFLEDIERLKRLSFKIIFVKYDYTKKEY